MNHEIEIGKTIVTQPEKWGNMEEQNGSQKPRL